MTYYTKFDTSIQCEERNEVSPEDQDEVFQMIADERTAPQDFAGYNEWLDTLEPAEREEIKDWQGGYSSSTDGPSYNGIDI